MNRIAITRTKAIEPAAQAGDLLILFPGEEGESARWLLVAGDQVAARGEGLDTLPDARPAKAVLAVPGTEAAIHWLDLDPALTQAQAAAAARLLLTEMSAEPIADMHVAAGAQEEGRTCAALVPARRMERWLKAAAAAGIDPALIMPETLLLLQPEEGVVRYDGTPVPCWRGRALAFAIEPELGEAIAGPDVRPLGEEDFVAGFGPALSAPLLNLRQGPFGRRREWRIEAARLRRLALLGLALIAVTLSVQVALVLRYTFAADRLQAEAASLSRGGPATARPGVQFAPGASALFEAVRATPNVEMLRMRYSGGTLSATLGGDSPASIEALNQRLRGAGRNAELGDVRTQDGRAVADMTMRPQ